MPSKMDRNNLDYIENLFEQYRGNSQSVNRDWKLFFDGVEMAGHLERGAFSKKELQVHNLIQTYREDGHLKARLDPLGLQEPIGEHLELSRFELETEDLDKKFEVFSLLHKKFKNLKEMILFLENTYCSKKALHVGGCSPEIRHWFFRKFEQNTFELDLEKKKKFLEKLTYTEAFEKFLHNRFLGAKRFSIEGADALVPMLEHTVDQGALQGVKEFVIGMSHRGRLNVMANFMNQPYETILAQFEGEVFSDMGFTGDVKYHIGYSCEKKTLSGKTCNALLGFNPSHLESIDPVVQGVTRALQNKAKDSKSRNKVVPILIHGDASFCGQGVVSETLQLSRLEGYTVGGTIHIIVNNQVGFTTEPMDGRSSRYASDLARSIGAPVLLVNADDVERCVQVMDMALEFRQSFQQDIIVDLISYRRFGHNEGDEPAFTQPLMYNKIKNHPTLMSLYKNQLIKEKVIQDDKGQAFQKYTDELQSVLDRIRKTPISVDEEMLRGSMWPYNPKPSLEEMEEAVETKAGKNHIDTVLSALTSETAGFNCHSKVKRLIQTRKKLMESKQVDWALAELLAYGTLCLEGHSVRLSGQDCKRGTFSHRHAVYYDSKDGREHIPLACLDKSQAEFCIYNSPLSEMAVLGFEYGNSCLDHSRLNIWEAQFGDFSNGAQIIIDQYISSGEEKWLQSCALTLLLPHGYEGQGPEHSSARLERYLQLCAQYNMQVCYPTTPANFFHVLRRQLKRGIFKPLVIMTPKSMLRHPQMISPIGDLLEGSFKEVIAEEPKDSVRFLVLCTGKVYFELLEKLPENFEHVLLIRVEQLYPFPKSSLGPYLNGFSELEKVIWLQEEPKNMGSAFFMIPRLRELLNELGQKQVKVEYVGRKEKASPATGSLLMHQEEHAQLIQEVIAKVHAG